jgi:hypothetical protein
LQAFWSGDWRAAASAHPLAPILPFLVAVALAAGWLRPQTTAAVLRAIRDRRTTAAFIVIAIVFGAVRA